MQQKKLQEIYISDQFSPQVGRISTRTFLKTVRNLKLSA
jgi:hypothetical protein